MKTDWLKEVHIAFVCVAPALQVDPCMADAHGLTPLHMAAQIADDEHLVAQQDPSKRDTATDSTTGTHVHGDSSLTVPVTESQSAVECIIKALATAGADVNAAAGMQRVTPLHLAGAMGHAAALRALLAAGADATQQDAAGKTALQQSTDRWVAYMNLRVTRR